MLCAFVHNHLCKHKFSFLVGRCLQHAGLEFLYDKCMFNLSRNCLSVFQQNTVVSLPSKLEKVASSCVLFPCFIVCAHWCFPGPRSQDSLLSFLYLSESSRAFRCHKQGRIWKCDRLPFLAPEASVVGKMGSRSGATMPTFTPWLRRLLTV